MYISGILKNITDYLEREQVNAMLDAPATVNHRNFLVIQVLWRTGVRVSELVSIRPRDIGWASQDSVAIHLVRSGMDLRRVQLLLGHSSLNFTQMYLQFKDDDIREVARDK